MFLSSTSNRQVYFPPSLAPTSLIVSGPSVSLGFCGSGFRKVSNKTLSLSHEILFNWVDARFPLSVKLQISVTSSSCSKTLESGTTTLGISLPKKATTKNTQLYTKQTDFNKLSMRVYVCIRVCLLGCWRIHYRRVVWGTAKSNSSCQNLPFKKCMSNIFFKFYSFKHHSSPLKQKTMQISLKQETQLHVHVLYIIVSS